MASASETGVNINYGNFQKVIVITDSMGVVYKPVRKEITSAELKIKDADHGKLVGTLTDATRIKNDAVDKRAATFDGIAKLTTRINDAAVTCGISDSSLSSVETYKKLIHGERLTPVAKAAPATPGQPAPTPTATISTSHRAYINVAKNFGDLVNLLANEPNYIPNEPELQLATLQALSDKMIDHNKKVDGAETNENNARNERNDSLYNEASGIITRVNLIKRYLRQLGTPGKSFLDQVMKLKFVRPPKKKAKRKKTAKKTK